MRKVVVSEFLTLDGVMQDPGGAGEIAQGGWSMPYWHDEIAKLKYDELFAADALLLGRVTYEGFAKAWPNMTGTGDFGERMNGLPKHVASTTLKALDWNNSNALEGDVAHAVAALKREPGQNILVAGSGKLIETLQRENLVDEYWLLVYPVVLGAGKRLFKDGVTTKLRLVETRSFPTGVALLRYEPESTAAAGA